MLRILSAWTSRYFGMLKNLRTGDNLDPNIVFAGAVPAYIDQVSLINNTLEGDTYGFEAALEWQVNDDWKLIGAYSFMAMDFDFGGQLEEFLNSFYARHQASLQSRLNLSRTVESDLWLTYTDEVAVQNQPELWDLRIRLGWRPSDQWQLELVGQNLLHSHRKQLTSEIISMVSSEIERGVFFRMNYQFQ